MDRARHLLKSSLLVIIFLALAKATGLVRVRLVGTVFGTGPEYDAFTAANQLPEVFFILIAGGSLAAAFIPVYSRYLASESAESSANLASTVLTLVVLLLGSVSALGALLAPWIVRVLLVPDFPAEMQDLTASIMRIILIQTTIFGFSGVLSSVLNAHQHFALPALAPLALDIGYVIGLLWLVPDLGIHGLAWGTVVGSVLHILIQVPALIHFRLRFRPELNIKMAGIGEIVRLMGPRIVTLGTIQLADLFIIRLASGLSQGSTSAYFYAYALMQLPETLFGTAIALVFFPTMAELYNQGDIAGLKTTAMRALSIIWTLTIPAGAALFLLGEPAIGLMFQGGQFDEASTRLVYTVLAVFSLRVVSEATLEIVARLFYAQHNTKTPMQAYLGWLLVNATLAFFLTGPLGIVGLALASTIAFTALSAALFFLNQRRLGPLGERALAISGGRAILATTGMAAAIWFIGRLTDSRALYLALAVTGGAVVYILLNLLLGGQEIPELIRLIRPGRNASRRT